MKFVIGTPTFNVDGITNSIEYIVENNVADILSLSYGSCEAIEGAGGNLFNQEVFEQAAAQGISVFVAAGDGGPAGCDLQGSQTYEVLGYATGAEASTPYSVSVGGTMFYPDASGAGTYWSATTNSLYLNSALSYIPEYPWNESRVASPLPSGDSGSDLWSGSGGISSYYLRPSWQQGPGITNGSDPALTLGNGAIGLWVASVNLTNPGAGYTTAPTVTSRVAVARLSQLQPPRSTADRSPELSSPATVLTSRVSVAHPRPRSPSRQHRQGEQPPPQPQSLDRCRIRRQSSPEFRIA